jgi:ribose-phosphate pyrophosphokinase
VGNAIKQAGMILKKIIVPYVPFGRQDRVSVKGECFSLQVFANLINSLGAEVVEVTDPHSDVTTALIHNCQVKEQAEVLYPFFSDSKKEFYLISPDAGALKKIYKLAEKLTQLQYNLQGIVECSKLRNVTDGKITGVMVHCGDLLGRDCYIVDDICDGGRTFIEIAKVLKTRNCGKIILMVSHGFFTKGLGVFDNLIDEIYTSTGRIK